MFSLAVGKARHGARVLLLRFIWERFLTYRYAEMHIFCENSTSAAPKSSFNFVDVHVIQQQHVSDLDLNLFPVMPSLLIDGNFK